MHAQDIRTSFHILIQASEPSANLCRTLLSSFLLNYPSPTLLGFNQGFANESWGRGSHNEAIKSILRFLSTQRHVRSDDLVLLIDGSDTWFQLPPEIMVTRYHTAIRIGNERLKRKYGMTKRKALSPRTISEQIQKYIQTIMFGLRDQCSPDQEAHSNCHSDPPPKSDEDFKGIYNDPKVMDSSRVLGPVRDLLAMYERALKKVEQGSDRGPVYAGILEEQENGRASSSETFGVSRRLRRWLSSSVELSPAASESSTTLESIATSQGIRYEYGIGLDRQSQLFKTASQSLLDRVSLNYSDISSLSHVRHDSVQIQTLPFDISHARPPFPSNNSVYDLAISRLIPASPILDQLPTNQTWYNLPLATDSRGPSVPILLHIDGEKSLTKSLWARMWLQPHARALLRRYMRSPQPPIWDVIGGGEIMWDKRGGRGGVWNDRGSWFSWQEVCRGYEEEVFADGKGVWGREEGDGRVFNFWGTQIIGDILTD